jgi:pimeloyl-ACP methyl ester carboxylesterase
VTSNPFGAQIVSDLGKNIIELADGGLLDQSIDELRTLEFHTRANNTNTVVLRSAMQRMRLRISRQLLSPEEQQEDENHIASQVREIVRTLDATPETLVSSTVERQQVGERNVQGGVRDVLLLVHGMKSRATWFELVRQVMTSKLQCQVETISYGWLDVPEFIWPFGRERRWPVRKIKDEIYVARAKYPNARITVLAHSYGTLALMHALKEPTIQVDRIIMCGAIVPERWNIERYLLLGNESTSIVNDCGTRDPWPVVAKCVAWGCGATGTTGFGKAGICDRKFPFSHGGFFDPSFISRYWEPFVRDGTIELPEIGDAPSLALSILSSTWVSLTLRLSLWLSAFVGVLMLCHRYWFMAKPYF